MTKTLNMTDSKMDRRVNHDMLSGMNGARLRTELRRRDKKYSGYIEFLQC